MSDQPTEQQNRLPVPAADDPEVQRWMRLGQWLAAAESPQPDERQRGMAAALRHAYTAELGLPLRAASLISIVRGRLVVHVELMRALAQQAGYRVVRLDEKPGSVTAGVLDRDGNILGDCTFTMDDARTAGLIKDKPGEAWATYPQRMLWARAAGYAMRDTIPEVVLGLVLHDEAREVAGQGYADIEGEAVDVDEVIREGMRDPVEQDEPEPEGVTS